MRINKSELSKKIGQLKGIVPSRTTIEALKGVLCSDGYLIACYSLFIFLKRSTQLVDLVF